MLNQQQGLHRLPWWQGFIAWWQQERQAAEDAAVRDPVVSGCVGGLNLKLSA